MIDYNTTLTIEPGVEVKFIADYDQQNLGDYSSDSELLVQGRLVANGTAAEPIIFTSTGRNTPTRRTGGRSRLAAIIIMGMPRLI